MAIELKELDEGQLPVAAELLAMRHSRDRRTFDYWPADFEDPAAARGQVESTLNAERARGLVAYDNGVAVGFAVIQPGEPPPRSLELRYSDDRYLSIPQAGHAVAEGADPAGVYRALYAELVRDGVSRGYLAHSVHIPGSEPEVREAFVQLGFGDKFLQAVAPVHPVEAREIPGLEIHVAGMEDIEVIAGLEHELDGYHTRSPILQAVDPATDAGAVAFQRGILSDPKNVHFVAYLDGEPAGMNTFMDPPTWLHPLYRAERSVYLYQGVVSERARTAGVGQAILAHSMRWMLEQGYTHCGLHYHAANPTGGPFWRRHGFETVEWGMLRRLDPRVTWARW